MKFSNVVVVVVEEKKFIFFAKKADVTNKSFITSPYSLAAAAAVAEMHNTWIIMYDLHFCT